MSNYISKMPKPKLRLKRTLKTIGSRKVYRANARWDQVRKTFRGWNFTAQYHKTSSTVRLFARWFYGLVLIEQYDEQYDDDNDDDDVDDMMMSADL